MNNEQLQFIALIFRHVLFLFIVWLQNKLFTCEPEGLNLTPSFA